MTEWLTEWLMKWLSDLNLVKNDGGTPLKIVSQCFKICIRIPQHMIKYLLLKSANAFARVSAWRIECGIHKFYLENAGFAIILHYFTKSTHYEDSCINIRSVIKFLKITCIVFWRPLWEPKLNVFITCKTEDRIGWLAADSVRYDSEYHSCLIDSSNFAPVAPNVDSETT